MYTDDDSKPKEILPGLKKLLSTNSSQEARLWAEEAEFHACRFKDAAKFFNEDYYEFNPKQTAVGTDDDAIVSLKFTQPQK